MSNSGINKVILIGNCGQDPDMRYTKSGKAVTNLSVATSEQWKDKNTGQVRGSTEWHRVVFFGGVAETAAKYLSKGSKIYVEGSLKTKKWQDNEGNDRYTTEVEGKIMRMLDGKGSSSPSGTAPNKENTFDGSDDIPF